MHQQCHQCKCTVPHGCFRSLYIKSLFFSFRKMGKKRGKLATKTFLIRRHLPTHDLMFVAPYSRVSPPREAPNIAQQTTPPRLPISASQPTTTSSKTVRLGNKAKKHNPRYKGQNNMVIYKIGVPLYYLPYKDTASEDDTRH